MRTHTIEQPLYAFDPNQFGFGDIIEGQRLGYVDFRWGVVAPGIVLTWMSSSSVASVLVLLVSCSVLLAPLLVRPRLCSFDGAHRIVLSWISSISVASVRVLLVLFFCAVLYAD